MPDARERWDVAIVGAGAVGALMAHRLAKAGARVLLLEAGPERKDRLELVGRFALQTEKIPSAPYSGTVADEHAPYPKVNDSREAGQYLQRGPDTFKSTYERLVGGSTWHWLGNTPRFVPNDFRLANAYGVGVDWPISYDDLEPWYAQAEAELGVAGDAEEWNGLFGATRSGPFPMAPIWPAYGDSIVADALNGWSHEGTELQLRVTPQARNSTTYQGRPSCAGNSSCVPICPVAAKYDASVHVELATRAASTAGNPAELRARAVVCALETDGSGRVTRIAYDRWSEDGATRVRERATADLVVVAAHAIESALLLQRSGLATRGPVGRYLMDHLQGYGGAILPRPTYPFRGPPVTSGIDAFRDGAFRADRAAFRLSVGNDGWGRMQSLEDVTRELIFEQGLLGETLRERVRERVTHMVRFSYSTEMLPDAENRVTLGEPDAHGNPRAEIHFALPDYNVAAFRFAKRLLEACFSRLGASDTKFTFSDEAPSYSGAGHIMGTCRMGTSAGDSVVDANCRAHEHDNLYVVGASNFPTAGTANPTLTAAALALRCADHIARRLGRRS